MTLLKRSIPPRAALAVVALALIASMVSGRQPEPGAPEPAPQTAPRSGERAAAPDTLADVDVEKLKRTEPQQVTDLLAPPAGPAPVVAPAATSAPPPAPAAPPLPFTYLGKLIDGGKTTVFVARGEDHYSVEPGTKIDQYKVQKITETAITFVFLPMGTSQVLVIPVPGQG